MAPPGSSHPESAKARQAPRARRSFILLAGLATLPVLADSTIVVAESNHGILYIGTGEGFGNIKGVGGVGIVKSYDRGQTWEHLSTARRHGLRAESVGLMMP